MINTTPLLVQFDLPTKRKGNVLEEVPTDLGVGALTYPMKSKFMSLVIDASDPELLLAVVINHLFSDKR